jgi:methylase of polypeptide subunit release factors
LISSENIQNEEDNETINPYDFKENFDIIIGNPPYMTTDEMKQILKLEYSSYYKRIYYSAYKQYDKYFLFIER